ncbi:MAG: 2-C-methyl-D-erythritol 4-phosphate cytidylyltransferase, partial [Candidatus Competibacteraceae bacterium]
GLLATPVRDTMKRSDAHDRSAATVERQNLWHALTPQMFRLNTLLAALQQAEKLQLEITDEASAIEAMGLQPRLVEGRADNIKITRPEDLALAEFYLTRERE